MTRSIPRNAQGSFAAARATLVGAVMTRIARQRRHIAQALAAGTLGAALAACSHAAQPVAAAAPFVQTSVASIGVIEPGEALAGVVAPYQNVAISSTLTEPADEVTVNEGDVVHRGEVLARLDTADLEAALASDVAQASSDRASTVHNTFAGSLSIAQGVDSLQSAQTSVRQAQANLARDQTDLHRFQELLRNGYIAEQQVAQQQTTVNDDAQTLRSNAAAVASARSNVAANGTNLSAPGLQSSTVQASQATEQVALANANQERVQISKATIVSPIDGVVVNRNLNSGEYPGTRQLFTIQQVNPVYAILHGSGAQIAEIATGATATIGSTDARRAQRSGTVAGVLNQIVPGSTDFQVKVILQNPDGSMRPGMAVSGSVRLPGVHGIRVPQTAFTDDNHDALMVVQNGTVKTVHVAEIADDGNTSIVTGIAAGTRVVSDGQTSVGDGEKVAIR
jgi:multidrug efflux pump subunit AcrA (membrane-fusion protein)